MRRLEKASRVYLIGLIILGHCTVLGSTTSPDWLKWEIDNCIVKIEDKEEYAEKELSREDVINAVSNAGGYSQLSCFDYSVIPREKYSTEDFKSCCTRGEIFVILANLLYKAEYVTNMETLPDKSDAYITFPTEKMDTTIYEYMAQLEKTPKEVWVAADLLKQKGVIDGDLKGNVNWSANLKGVELAKMLYNTKDELYQW